MNANVWVVREPGAERALWVGDSRSEAVAKALRFVRYFHVCNVVFVELHDFQAACDRDWRFPRDSSVVQFGRWERMWAKRATSSSLA